MKKLILIIFILLISFCIFTKEENDYSEVDEKLYGLKKFSEEEEIKLNKMHFAFIPVLKKIINNESSINELELFLKEVNNETLLGIFIRDSLIQYIKLENNIELLNLLKNHFKNNNSEAIKEIIKIRENIQNYSGSNFCFSTVLSRKNIYKNISMITPNSDWQEMNYENNTDSITLHAGDQNYAGTIYIKYYRINNRKLDISKDIFEAKHETILFKRSPVGEDLRNLKEDDLYKIRPGKVILISENTKIGNIVFDKIYEQITINSEKYNFQKLVDRTRFYIKGFDLYLITVRSIIGGDHVLANKINLINQHGLLLDTVIFE